MIEEVYCNQPHLFVGDIDACYDWTKKKKGAIIHVCKEPCHRSAVGYSGRALEKSHPEYLVAQRGTKDLYLNLVDTSNPAFFSVKLIEEALFFLSVRAREGTDVLIHCNKGESRAPSLALLYIYTQRNPGKYSLKDAVEDFRYLYPAYTPNIGIYEHMEAHWQDYITIGHILAL